MTQQKQMVLAATKETIAEAAEALLRGELVVFPTETVYGLGADATQPEAVRAIFEAKRRPFMNPLIIHVSSIDHAKKCVAKWSPEAQRLAEAFWPGPLSIILPKGECISDVVTGGGATVAIRMPDHPVALQLIEKSAVPVAAPSANLYTELSPTSPEDVVGKFDDAIACILDGGRCEVGIESTVVSLVDGVTVLRPGRIKPSEIAEVLGREVGIGTKKLASLTEPEMSPGMARKHYAPSLPLHIVEEEVLGDRVAFAVGDGEGKVFVLTRRTLEYSGGYDVQFAVLGDDSEGWESRIYAYLHQVERGVYGDISEIFVVNPENTSDDKEKWLALLDRLRRASASD